MTFSTLNEVKALARLATPIVFSNLAMFGMSMTVLVAAGHIGADELTAVAYSQMLFDITILIFAAGFVVGQGSLSAQAFGAKNYSLIGRYCQMNCICTSVVSIFIGIIWWFSGDILSAVGISNNAAHHARQYCHYSVIWIWPRSIFQVLTVYFKSMQNVLPAAVFAVVFTLINIGLVVLLVFGIPSTGFAGLGLVGCPIALSITHFSRLFVYIIYMFWYRRHHISSWPWDTDFLNMKLYLFPMMKIGIPMALGQLVENLQLQTMSIFAAMTSEVDLAANNSMMEFIFFLTSPIYGMIDGGSTRIGMYLGAGKPKAAKSTSHLVFYCIFGLTILVVVPWLCARNVVGKLFSSDDAVIKSMASISTLAAAGYIILAFFYYAMTTLQAQARTLPIMASFLIGAWFVGVPAAYLFGFPWHLHLLGIWIGMSFGYFTTTLLGFYFTYKSDWQKEACKAVERSKERDRESIPPFDTSNSNVEHSYQEMNDSSVQESIRTIPPAGDIPCCFSYEVVFYLVLFLVVGRNLELAPILLWYFIVRMAKKRKNRGPKPEEEAKEGKKPKVAATTGVRPGDGGAVKRLLEQSALIGGEKKKKKRKKSKNKAPVPSESTVNAQEETMAPMETDESAAEARKRRFAVNNAVQTKSTVVLTTHVQPTRPQTMKNQRVRLMTLRKANESGGVSSVIAHISKEAAETKPEPHENEPDSPGSKSDSPENKPSSPATNSGGPGNRPDSLATNRDSPKTNESPKTNPGSPKTNSGNSESNLESPESKFDTPIAAPIHELPVETVEEDELENHYNQVREVDAEMMLDTDLHSLNLPESALHDYSSENNSLMSSIMEAFSSSADTNAIHHDDGFKNDFFGMDSSPLECEQSTREQATEVIDVCDSSDEQNADTEDIDEMGSDTGPLHQKDDVEAEFEETPSLYDSQLYDDGPDNGIQGVIDKLDAESESEENDSNCANIAPEAITVTLDTDESTLEQTHSKNDGEVQNEVDEIQTESKATIISSEQEVIKTKLEHATIFSSAIESASVAENTSSLSTRSPVKNNSADIDHSHAPEMPEIKSTQRPVPVDAYATKDKVFPVNESTIQLGSGSSSEWGASFGTKPPIRSQQIVNCSPLSTWFLSCGQANFIKQTIASTAVGNVPKSVSNPVKSSASPKKSQVNLFYSNLAKNHWRTWYNNSDSVKDSVLDAPLHHVPSPVKVAVDNANPISISIDKEHPIDSLRTFDNVMQQLEIAKGESSAFERQMIDILQGKTMAGLEFEDAYRSVLPQNLSGSDNTTAMDKLDMTKFFQ